MLNSIFIFFKSDPYLMSAFIPEFTPETSHMSRRDSAANPEKEMSWRWTTELNNISLCCVYVFLLKPGQMQP